MKYMKIGSSELTVSRIGLGAWAIGGGSWWGDNDDRQSIKTIHAALDVGINLIDTAPAYGLGHSEIVVGEALRGKRDQYVLSTKCGLWWHDDEGAPFYTDQGKNIYRNISKRAIVKEVEFSLKRLKTDYIDIYITHWQAVEPFKTPIEETMEALIQLKKEGKIRSIGISNATESELLEYQRYGAVDLMQQHYSLLEKDVEQTLIPFCKKTDITLQAYSPLEQGLLAGGITMDYKVQEGSVRAGNRWFDPERLQRVLNMLHGWKELCDKYQCTLSHLAIAALLCANDNVNVLCGARRMENLYENAEGADLELSAEDIVRIKSDCDSIIAQG